MKRFFTIALCVIFSALILMSFAVSAAQKPVSVVCDYCKSGIFSVFVNPNEGVNPSDVKIGLVPTEKQKLKMNVSNSSAKVNYLFLLDASTSMPTYKSKISELASSLFNKSKKGSITLAVFGDKFKVVKKNIKSWTEFNKALVNVDYSEPATDIAGGLCDAIDFAAAKSRKINEVYNIILVTDGIPYLTSYEGSYDNAIKSSAKDIKKKIAKYPEIIINSVGTNSWNKDIESAVKTGKGLHLKLDNASAAGGQIASFINNLFILNYEVNAGSRSKNIDAKLYASLKGGNDIILKIKDIPNLDYDRSSEKETEPSTSKPQEKTAVHTNPPETKPEAKKPAEAKTEKTENNSEFPLIPVIIIAAAALVVIAAVLIILLKLKGKKPDSSYPTINMKLEILAGKASGNKDRIILGKELFIGSSPSCDICLNDLSVADKNTRIFQKDGLIYIENITEANNTTLGGMKLFAPNRLRSGDEIGIGNTIIVLRF